MATKNDITGDTIQSRTVTDAYREGWDRIFQGSNTCEVWIIEEDENFFNIIVDYHDNPNCFIRLNREQFRNLRQQIIKFQG